MTHGAGRRTSDWTISGAAGEPIRGTAHFSDAPSGARAVALLAHGFKGYKDYGFLPLLAERLAGELPLVVHRFNFSHSGVGDDASTFQRPELFERDTWNKQVFDLGAVMDAAVGGELPGTPAGLPMITIGHSRGGVTCLLDAGRRFRDGAGTTPGAIVTMSAPCGTMNLSQEDRAKLLEQGYLSTPSTRTGQELRIGREWLREQLDHPRDHSLRALCGLIACPVLIVHGAADPTVSADHAEVLAAACPDAQVVIIDGADHVYNTPNPADPEAERSVQLSALLDTVAAFLRACGPLAK